MILKEQPRGESNPNDEVFWQSAYKEKTWAVLNVLPRQPITLVQSHLKGTHKHFLVHHCFMDA